MPSARVLLLAFAGVASFSTTAFSQSARPNPSRINPNGNYSRIEPRATEAIQPRGQGPGVGYGVTFFGWPIVPYYGGAAYGPGLSGLGPQALKSNYPNAGYGYTAPPRETVIRAELAEKERLAKEAAEKARARKATVTLELPAAAELWVNGKKQDGVEAKPVLTSDAVAPGTEVTFTIRAEWTLDGKRYEWERVVTVTAGEKGRVTVLRGFLMK